MKYLAKSYPSWPSLRGYPGSPEFPLFFRVEEARNPAFRIASKKLSQNHTIPGSVLMMYTLLHQETHPWDGREELPGKLTTN
ncbi:MAG TPA: hypothetical protein VN648_00095, partial [Candidatus Methylomirabilis sp.]|nr:hypothetical protein [Candidatus Methylomirabilis sp.]